MKKILILILFCFHLILCNKVNGQKLIDSTAQNLKCIVKSVKITKYKPFDSSGVIVKGKITGSQLISFDSNGKIVDCRKYRSNGRLIKGSDKNHSKIENIIDAEDVISNDQYEAKVKYIHSIKYKNEKSYLITVWEIEYY